MNLPKKSILPCFLYGIPYIILIYLLTYYFDFIERAYPPFLPAILLILLLFPIYIGLGCLCGRENRASLCLFGTICHLLICKLCIAFLLPALQINNGVANAYFPLWGGFIIFCQLIGYYGTKS